MELFKLDCMEVIDRLTTKYTVAPSEALLWIYLNIYLYQDEKYRASFSKEDFLNRLREDTTFKNQYQPYQHLPQEEYNYLFKLILTKYTYQGVEKNITIKVMEEFYEGMLHKDLRVKTGSYYTPSSIVEYMTSKTITIYIDNRMKQYPIKLQDYLNGDLEMLPMDYIVEVLDVLENIKIIDIACGGGVFLRGVVSFLLDLKLELNQLLGRTPLRQEIIRSILQKNLYGVDIQVMTVTMCKLFLLMELQGSYLYFHEGRALNIISGNALTLDFSKEFGGVFDLVIGNPPYIGEKGNKALFDAIRSHDFGKRYYERKMDYFYFFIYRAYELLKEAGILSYITTNYFVTADGAKKLRGFLKENYHLKTIVNFNTYPIFSEAKGQHNMIFIASKEMTEGACTILMNVKQEKIKVEAICSALMKGKNTKEIDVSIIPQQELYDDTGQLLIQSDDKQLKILNKIQSMAINTLQDLCYVNQGIVSGGDKLSGAWATRLNRQKDKGRGIFVLTAEEIEELDLEEEIKKRYLKVFHKNSHIKKYETLKKEGLYILYIYDENLEAIEAIPTLYRHFVKFKELLQQRREVKNGVRKWYALQWPRQASIFEEEKIVVPQRALQNTFAYVEGPWYASADVYYITAKEKQISLMYLLGVLNSSLIYFWLYHRGKRKGQYLELYATPLKTIPIHYTSNKGMIRDLENLVKVRMEEPHLLGGIEEIQNKIDELVFQLYKLTEGEKEVIKDFIRKQK